MRIAIVGAGAVGSYYGGTLARAGNEVAVLARGEHLRALVEKGIEVHSPGETFVARVEATADPKSMGPADFAIVGVKTYSLAEVVPALWLLAEAGATIVPFLNGVDAAERLEEAGIPKERILGGLTSVSVVRTGPGVVERRSPFQKVTVGELRGGVSARAESLGAAFREAGAEVTVSADITADLWRKLAFIATMGAACGLSRSPIGGVRKTALGALLIERAVREAFAVARARGVNLAPDEEAKTLQFLASLGDGMKPSILVDLEAGNRTEVEDLSGAISRLGRLTGVETPIHDTATAAIGAASATA